MKQVNTSKGLLNYTSYGSGPVVMLIHGFGESGAVWGNQVEALQRSYRILVPELPGTGGSELIPGLSMETMAASLHDLWLQERASGDEQFVILGHSMGGYITMAYVEQYADSLRGFGLIHSSAFADTVEKKETRQKGIRVIREKGAAAYLATSSPGLFSEETRQHHPELVSDFLARFGELPADSLIAYQEAMMARPDRSSLLKTSALPTLLAFGKTDTAVKIEDGLRQSHYPEKSYIDVLTHSGHLGMLEEPARLNAILEDFLAKP